MITRAGQGVDNRKTSAYKTLDKTHIGRKWEDNIQMDIRANVCEGENWIEVAHDKANSTFLRTL
jgi:hypothetical protein